MKPDSRRLASLVAILGDSQAVLGRLNARLDDLAPALQSATPAPKYEQLAGAAYALHNIYTALEDLFEQISRTFENHVTDPGQWHRELLHKMFLEIPTVRPALLPPQLKPMLNDLRGFRHLFRHAYDFELDPARLDRLIQDWVRSRALVSEALEAFRLHLARQLTE